jgi:hypothetical protein
MFNQGQKVVCINDKQLNSFPVGGLKEGEIYTVEKDLGFAIYLKEVKAPSTGHYNANRFRKVDDDWIEELLCKLMSEVESDDLVSA